MSSLGSNASGLVFSGWDVQGPGPAGAPGVPPESGAARGAARVQGFDQALVWVTVALLAWGW
jgi:hypothetical protein